MNGMKKREQAVLSKKENTPITAGWAWLLLIVAALAFFAAQSASWLNNNVFDQKQFTAISSSVLLSHESRDVIADEVVNRVLQDRPLIRKVVGERASTYVSGLLGTDTSRHVLNSFLNRSYAYMTSSQRENIAIELTSIKQPLSLLISLSGATGHTIDLEPSNIPDEIILVRSETLPDFSPIVRISAISAFFLWLLFLMASFTYIVFAKADRVRRVNILGAAVAGVALFGLALIPFIPMIVASYIDIVSLRGVTADLASAYLAPLSLQFQITLILVVIILLLVKCRGAISTAATTAYKSILRRDK